jgi:uncharacterized protein YkwD
MTWGGRGRAVIVLAWLAAFAAVAVPAARPSSVRAHAHLSSLESGIVRQLNEIRAQHGLPALRTNPQLNAAAAQHSREMGADGYFEHSSYDGASFSTRIGRWYGLAGHSSWTVGENLLWASPDVDPGTALEMWMASPGHRANILSPLWREIGISAVHFSSAGGVYGSRPVTVVTTDFGVRR